MSHFAVLVVGEEVEKQLAPFQENNMGDCPEEFMTFFNKEEDPDMIAEYEAADEETKQEYPTFAKYLKDYHGYTMDEKTGKIGYWENPNAKWDWYQEGGRWSGMLLTKDGKRVDSALIGDIDFEEMARQSMAAREKYWEEAQSKDPVMQHFAYGIKKDDTKESYVARGASFAMYAVIKDSKWYAKGEMGWFGMSRDDMEEGQWEEEFNKLLKSLTPDTRITVIDCHI